MAQATRRDTSVVINNPDAANIVPTAPAGLTDGDFMILTITSDSGSFSGATIGNLGSWTERTTGTQSTNCQIRIWTKTAASEPASYSVTTGGISAVTARWTAYNPNGGTAQYDDGGDITFDDTGTATVSTTASVDVSSSGNLYCEFYNDSVRTVSANPSGMTILATDDGATSTASAWDQNTSGAGITKSLTWSSGEQFCAVTLAFSAPGGGGTIVPKVMNNRSQQGQ